MATKAKKIKKKSELSWEEIGENIGRKIKTEFEDKDMPCNPHWDKQWVQVKEHGGGFGRLVFIVGILLLSNHMGWFPGTPWWIKALIVVGFAAMRF
jgi:hypothetical protein